MSLTILQIKAELAAMMHGTTLDNIANQSGVFNRAARQLMADVDLFETKRKTTTPLTVFDSVYDYSAPANLKADKIIDIRKQAKRYSSDQFTQKYNEDFDANKSISSNFFTVEYRNGTKVLRVDDSINKVITVDTVNDTTGWAVGGDATNLTQDTLNYITGSASLNFDLSGAGTSGYLEKTLTVAIDLSEHEDQSSLFTWVFIPDVSIITSFNLRWGNDSSNYWDRTVTAGHFDSFTNGWNLLRFDWNGATETGAPASATTDYLRFTVNYDGTADTDLRLDNIVSNLGALYEVLYYGDQIFQDNSGTFISRTTLDTDIVILEDQSMNLFVYKSAEMMAQQAQQQGQNVDVGYFANEYAKQLRSYKQDFLSEAIRPQSSYYSMNRNSVRRTLR